MAMQPFYSHVMASGGISGEVFDLCQGPANLGIVDFLLGQNPVAATALVAGKMYVITLVGTTDFVAIGAASDTVGVVFTATGPGGAGTTGTCEGACAITEDTPLMIKSTGALGAPAIIELVGAEAEIAGNGGVALKGRMHYLSVRNTDILANAITLVAGATINGSAVPYTIKTEGDYLLMHEEGGAWRLNVLPRPAENLAVMARVDFVSADWSAANKIKCIQTGIAGLNEIGPHDITVSKSYVVQIVNTDLTPDEQVGVQVQFAANGDITLGKAAKAPAFAGTLLIVGTID